jgi:rhodanese-related sulfurtransferase
MNNIKEITVQELKQLIADSADFQLIDVREEHEYQQANLNGLLIPLGTVPNNIKKFDREKQVIVHCRSGKRSADAIAFLQQKHGFTNLYNLQGGILAWLAEKK